jgi:hypothetical protein
MKKALALAALILPLFSFQLAYADNFPTGPNAQLTPGALCTHPDARRYRENIAYCERNVRSGLKEQIIEEYDRRFGFCIEKMPRDQFKIDHYIPLCMGGANSPTNLWPQHESVYTITDPLEEALCGKMAEGKLLQKDAIDMIKEAKNHLDEVPGILAKVHAL